ncbi:hypothetical protein BASA61_001900 [Batrachochytrium salamandrivorans]|nr:hypothetical protein BASA62_008084 [Batrachochytrium salamandrivorans]KAH6572790.1 hypothetical protein BASA60_006465 [Batrachochytrium salamandrivorans]KAH6601696.1 hypothetical protein BASA61_001900 [Batrachochytrium salamandrivorans]KAH9273078.1 hypothetical protein BASA83_004655 [Batrachochytrium salamandrivorans]
MGICGSKEEEGGHRLGGGNTNAPSAITSRQSQPRPLASTSNSNPSSRTNLLSATTSSASSSQKTSAATREDRLLAAEARKHANENRGVQSTGGALSKKLQEQNVIGPGRLPPNPNILNDNNLQWRAD